ncbi:MAG TPA: KpsF/GutQ family sugar-phosphate isomerase [Azospirillaceae bacterium]|nr:KpsF/GutQ family sugar-phosphate isomerase [Azospirillaceae bacterium]
MTDQASLSAGSRTGAAHDDIAVARRILGYEAAALTALAGALDDRFRQAVEALASVRGRVVVTGMGKSGHVARKIAATLASTGTPALFVHPAEASHGDLGMIAPDDAVVALSNSGDTPELAAVLTFTRRFRIPLVAITSRARSALAEQADVVLLLPDLREACPLGLAPTTSTTMMMALGDGLAGALLERRGFSAEEFGIFHPGGKLGAKLLRVGDIMHTGDELPLVPMDARMSEAIIVMSAKGFGVVGIQDGEGRLAGIITDGDLRRHMDARLLEKTVAEVMTRGPKTIHPGALAADALGWMNGQRPHISVLFVVEADQKPRGLIRIHDILSAGVA